MRRLHYSKIEGEMNEITRKIQELRGQEQGTVSPQEEKAFKSRLKTLLVVVPAVGSAFLLGYLLGRTQGTFKRQQQLRLATGLNQDRVYVAVVPERLFEAKVVARELERAVKEADTPAAAASSTWLQRFHADTMGTGAAKPQPRSGRRRQKQALLMPPSVASSGTFSSAGNRRRSDRLSERIAELCGHGS